MILLYAQAMGKSHTKHLLITLFKDAEKLWKVKVIAARQADFSQSQQDKLVWLLKEKYRLQRCCR